MRTLHIFQTRFLSLQEKSSCFLRCFAAQVTVKQQHSHSTLFFAHGEFVALLLPLLHFRGTAFKEVIQNIRKHLRLSPEMDRDLTHRLLTEHQPHFTENLAHAHTKLECWSHIPRTILAERSNCLCDFPPRPDTSMCSTAS